MPLICPFLELFVRFFRPYPRCFAVFDGLPPLYILQFATVCAKSYNRSMDSMRLTSRRAFLYVRKVSEGTLAGYSRMSCLLVCERGALSYDKKWEIPKEGGDLVWITKRRAVLTGRQKSSEGCRPSCSDTSCLSLFWS